MVKKLGKRYLQTKKTIYAAYDILSLVGGELSATGNQLQGSIYVNMEKVL